MITTFRRYLKTAKSYGCFEAIHPSRFKLAMLTEISSGQQIAIEDEQFSRKVLDRHLDVQGCTRLLESMVVDQKPHLPLQVEEFKNFSFLCSFVEKQLRRKHLERNHPANSPGIGRLGVLLLLICGYVVKTDKAFITSAISAVQRKLPPLILERSEQLQSIDLLRAAHGEMISRNRPELLFQYADRLAKLPLDGLTQNYLSEVLHDSSSVNSSTGVELLQGLLVDALIVLMPALPDVRQLIDSLKALARSKVNLKDSRMQRLASIVAMKLAVISKSPADDRLVVTSKVDSIAASKLLSSLSDLEKSYTHGFLIFEELDEVYDHLVAVCKRATEQREFVYICSDLYRSLNGLKYFDRHLLLEALRSMGSIHNLRTYGLMLKYVSMCAASIQEDARIRTLLLSDSFKRLTKVTDEESEIDHIAVFMWSLSVIFQPFEIVEHIKLLSERLIRLHRDKDMPLYILTMICTTFEYMKSYYTPPDGISLALISNLLRMKETHHKEVSMLNLEVVEVLNRLKIRNTIEKKLGILEVDVVVKGSLPDDIEICIDVHGYQHYFRNHEELLGNNYLKGKMIRQLGYGYFEISLPVWSALDLKGKKEYLIEGIKRLRLPSS